MKKKILAIVSGGLDSVTMAYELAVQSKLGGIVTFDYGQRHNKEIKFAALCASRLGVPQYLVDLHTLGALLKGGALTDMDVPIPVGNYNQDNMSVTVVPGRNGIMLSIAAAMAVSNGYGSIGIGIHSGDHTLYKDCRPRFITAFKNYIKEAIDEEIVLYTPYINKSKADIVKIGDQYGVPWEETWSCYQGEEFHCGQCGTCRERKTAFMQAKILDPTEYGG